MNRVKKKMAAYWHKEGLDIYSFQDETPIKFAAGALEDLKPMKRGRGAKILIVGRGQSMHLRKRYPPAPKEKLVKAVSLEIGELFPLAKPGFYCRVFKSLSNYVELDIWGWETDGYEKLKEIFPFSHVIPEDLLFTADEPEVRISQYGGMVNMIAHAQGRFLDSASTPLAAFDDGQVSRFLFSLRQTAEEVKRIRIYGLLQFQLRSFPGIELVCSEEKIYPPCMADVVHVDLKEFKIQSAYFSLPLLQPVLVMRICLYLVLGYGLLLFITMYNYDQALTKTRKLIAGMDKKAVTQDATQPLAVDYTDVVKEVNDRIKKGPSPLKTMNMLAQKLPEGSFVSRIILSENNLELLVSSKDPLELVKALGSDEMVGKVKIKGSPNRDSGTGLYTFVIILELMK